MKHPRNPLPWAALAALLPLGAAGAAPSLAEQAARALEAQDPPVATYRQRDPAGETPIPATAAPPTLEETPAQRYYRLVEAYRLNHEPPRDTLGEILKRYKQHPWPPRKAE